MSSQVGEASSVAWNNVVDSVPSTDNLVKGVTEVSNQVGEVVGNVISGMIDAIPPTDDVV